MTTTFCSYEGHRDEMIVASLYDDGDPAARAAFETHVAACASCQEELAALRAVRSELSEWSPPGLSARVFDFAPAATARRSRVWTALAEIPAWAQVAAALLVLGVAAGAANLQITYDSAGLVVRTGWIADTAPIPGAASERKLGPASTQTGDAAAPWRAELAALERQLRSEWETGTVQAARRADPRSDAEVLRRVRALVDESERHQRRELALRVAEMAREVQAQRASDLQRIQSSLGAIEYTTRADVMRQGKLLNNLAVRVSQQQ